MLKKEITDFLSRTPPFNMLDQDDLDELASHIAIEFYPRGLKILNQNGPPTKSLRIIKKGGVKVFMTNEEGNDVVIDYRSEGDSFGYVSLVTGDKSRASILAIEDTICYLVGKESLLRVLQRKPLLGEYFMKSFFVNFIDKTYQEMRGRSIMFGEGDKLLYTTPVRDIVSREAVTARAPVSIQEAAAMMTRQKISSLIIVDENGVPIGIVTDRDLRDKVVARGIDVSSSVERIMSPPLVRADAHETCFEALIKMIRYNIHHLIIVDRGNLKGVVTNHDFMLLQGISPLSLAKNIEGQKRVEGLFSIQEKINKIISLLFKEGVKAGHITRIITELHDRLLRKFIEISTETTGESPVPFAFVIFGSEGRKEQTFKTVFDCAIVYEEPKISAQRSAMKEFSEGLLSNLSDFVKKCEFPMFDRNLFGDGISLYGSIDAWEKVILSSLVSEENRKVLAAKKFLDLRAIYGDHHIADLLRERLFEKIRNDERYVTMLVESTMRNRSPLGFFKQFVVEIGGEHKDKLNLKEKGIIPIVDALRVLAITQKIMETPTLERLEILSKNGQVLSVPVEDVSSAFEFLMHLRIQAQIRKKEHHEEINDFIEPEKLSLLEKKTLKEAFQIIPRLQSAIEEHFMKQGMISR